MGEIDRRHYAIIGTATVVDNYPLYYEATNEVGLSVAGLNFVGNAFLSKTEIDGKINIAPYELIPYLLGRCKTCADCIEILKNMNIVDRRIKDSVPNSELHWMISDKNSCYTLENVREGMMIYDNPVGILTNNPTFDQQMLNLSNYINLTIEEPINRFSKSISLTPYSRGMGAIGLPGDNSSMSRFVRASFTKMNSVKPSEDDLALVQAFHILASVEQQEGTVVFDGKYEKTQYTSCCDTNNGVYYYKTYENSQITAVNMYKEDLKGEALISYKMGYDPKILYIN